MKLITDFYDLSYMRLNRTWALKGATVAETVRIQLVLHPVCLEALLFALRVGDVMNL